MTAPETMGTRTFQALKPIFLSLKYFITPPAPARPKALPPEK
jgi:hypothetical protein